MNGFVQGTVSKILKKYKSINNVEKQYQNSGRPSLTQEYPMLQNLIKEELVSKNCFNSKQISYNFSEKHKIDISYVTVTKILKELCFNYKRIKQIHKLIDLNKEKRIDYINENLNNIHQFTFSDESIFSIDSFNQMQWINGEELNGIYEHRQQSYKNRFCHVWAGISNKGKTSLYFHKKKVDSVAYQQCINESYIPYLNKYIDKRKRYYLIQDGAPSHTSKSTEEYFYKLNIRIIQLPPCSPDMNPIELIWNIMKIEFKKQLLQQKLENSEQIQQCLENIWSSIIQQTINN